MESKERGSTKKVSNS